jgi:hypothetical protein
MASAWIVRRPTKDGGVRHRVVYRVGGAESRHKYGGSFPTRREAKARLDYIRGELAARRMPDLTALAEPVAAPMLRQVADRWATSRIDVTERTATNHRSDLARGFLPTLGDRDPATITADDIAALVIALHKKGLARETLRKSLKTWGMVMDYAGVTQNPCNDRRVKLPIAEVAQVDPPTATHCWPCTTCCRPPTGCRPCCWTPRACALASWRR